ncbi:oxygen-independent coproporphyrinogen III oxidase [Herbaspirillum seropedicae]|uniref:Coproporphyrinogen-III oxidase n=1 Tax=Herbaspirillum seropedicae (strain SmR1) TaxID=757424 RepID=D8J1C0_HERSS|nr:oxygen-independent coproporphyrinogen III oxidase [Herbaspirillum seropedicae]ADJ64689.1 oxygen-independent coproporphyrinogen III oxidase protein [Herbaspirillum seropedicae SmR1]AKN66605.1 coproporphyrinogen III oxidase [Herbaspirillum seropedicae]AON55433.1 oxygen-independent coproporphyrinogen III oxidase [Herbaspirillum seropedicae]MDR6397259.1 oxygen-independent coproporphyrinogen-3 oxidase [Herbaspirillum seropedicae]NQE28404.1 coproporphyrinogen III oxidase [Herbaspirillum seropedic
MQVAHPSTLQSSASLAGMNKSVLRRMDQRGPRYTSYPTADRFTSDFAVTDYLHAVSDRRSMSAWRALSLYLHIPFCDTICYYCACNKIVTKNRAKAALYLSYLKREISMQGSLFSGMNQVEQLHFGGGTPTYLSDEQMSDLMDHIRHCFTLAPDHVGEYSIEIDPRTVSVERVHKLRQQGFNRISLGVQDFDPEVQLAVNRVQSEEQTLEIIRAARDAGFRSVSIDLIYGLPKQNVMSMSRTLAKVIAASPDRIAVYNYAHMPQLFKTQRQIKEEDLPSADSKLDMLSLCIRQLTSAGYVYIGMDHFAKPTDDLAIAQQQGRLHRNFQGYSTHSETDLVACGVSAISAVGGSYSQNEKTLDDYYARLENSTLPIARGIQLGMDDVLRRLIIQRLMCNFELSINSLEIAYPIVFREYFASEMEKLKQLEEDGLIKIEPEWITVEPKGRLLIRNICMVFDRYLNQEREKAASQNKDAPQRYSQTV